MDIYHNLLNLLLMNVRFPVFCCYSDNLEPKVTHICAGYSYKLNSKSVVCTNVDKVPFDCVFCFRDVLGSSLIMPFLKMF